TQKRDDAQRFVPLTVAHRFVEGVTRDQLGHQVGRLAVIRQLVDTRNRLVLERRIRAQLQHEAARKAHITRDAGADGAHRHPAVQALMLSLVDGAEAVGVQLAHQRFSSLTGSTSSAGSKPKTWARKLSSPSNARRMFLSCRNPCCSPWKRT